MRRLLVRACVNGMTALSLLVCGASACLWAAGYWRPVAVTYGSDQRRGITAVFDRGGLYVGTYWTPVTSSNGLRVPPGWSRYVLRQRLRSRRATTPAARSSVGSRYG
jgi:hypothetical protein